MNDSTMRFSARYLLVCLALVTTTLLAATGSAQSAPVQQSDAPSVTTQRLLRASDNPLADRRWGVYKGKADQAWMPYVRASGTTKDLLAQITLRPRSKWFGAWVSPRDITGKVRDYVRNSQAGNPETLVQMTTFALKPWEHAACKSLPTAAQRSFFRRWSDAFAAGIGDAHAAVVVQADGPFALCAPGGSKMYSYLIRYQVRKLAALPNTSVYIDAGAADWLKDDPARAARILVPAGVQYARGFALNSTHYSSTTREVRFGAEVVQELASRDIPGKRFIVNTSSNGKPFAGYTYKGPDFDHARVCSSTADSQCVTLGIPPTYNVAATTWALPDDVRAKAASYCDAYMWFGRPWLYRQADPFDLPRALQLVRTTPF